MAQTCQLDGGNNVGATTVTMPIQSEGKEVSGIITMMLVQQGDNTRAMMAMAPVQQGQQCHRDNCKDACAMTMVMMPL